MGHNLHVWKKNKHLIIAMFAIPVTVATIFIVGTILKEKIAVYREERFIKEQIEEQKKLAQERLDKIEKNLSESGYENDLRNLYEQYPQIHKLLLNYESYPEELISYLIKTPEAVDWVVAYPEYAEKSEQELNMEALKALDLSAYEVNGGIPTFYQWDLAWGYTTYGEDYMAVTGCAPTCLAMVAVGLTGDTTITPKKVADISIELGAYVEEVGTSWNLMTLGAAKLGLTSEQIDTWTASALTKKIAEGNPIICSMKEGDFTTQGHFIVLVGVTEEGKVLVNDPNSKANTAKEWEAQRLLDQMKGMWVITN